MNQSKDKKIPPATPQADPDPEIELKVKKHPDDEDAKADLGSDEYRALKNTAGDKFTSLFHFSVAPMTPL